MEEGWLGPVETWKTLKTEEGWTGPAETWKTLKTEEGWTGPAEIWKTLKMEEDLEDSGLRIGADNSDDNAISRSSELYAGANTGVSLWGCHGLDRWSQLLVRYVEVPGMKRGGETWLDPERTGRGNLEISLTSTSKSEPFK